MIQIVGYLLCTIITVIGLVSLQIGLAVRGWIAISIGTTIAAAACAAASIGASWLWLQGLAFPMVP